MPSSAREIFFWYPNLIGYARVILAIISFCYYENPFIFFWCYLVSFLLDAADGHVARMFNQCSRFGAVLDMVTDRFATACLVVILSHLYFPYRHICMLLIILDLCSHWLRVVASLLVGEGHKNIKSGSKLLQIYYHNRLVLGLVCLGNELFYIALYMAYFFPQVQIFDLNLDIFGYFVLLCFPVFLLKQLLNIIQLRYSAWEIVEWEFINEHQKK